MFGGALGGAPVDFGHKEGLVAVAVLEGFSHAAFALAFAVIPRVVHEGKAVVDGGADEADGEGFGDGRIADVGAAEAYAGDLFTGFAEGAGRDSHAGE